MTPFTTRRPRTAFLRCLVLVAAGACNTDKLVNVQNPDLVTVTVANDPKNIDQIRNGASFYFARSLTGPAANNGTPGIVGLGGLFTDEMWYVSTFPTMQDIDRRNITDLTNVDLLTAYQYLHQGRNMSERAMNLYATVTGSSAADYALVTNMAGYAYIFFAEDFCSGVPVSATDFTGAITYGPPLTTANLLDSAIARFDLALTKAGAANSAALQNLARVGKARALLARGDLAGAAAIAATVPAGFTYDVEYSPNASSLQNGVYYNINSEKRSSAASLEGINGLDYFKRGPKPNTTDARTPADSLGVGLGTQFPHFVQHKYNTPSAGVTLGSSMEARLIEAEAALNKGQSGAYLASVNALRAAAGLTALADPGTADARVRQFFRERAFFLWLSGHRLGDLRRLVKFYGYAAESVFPTGQTIQGASYGTDVNLPIPFQEQNNPAFANGACVDRNA